ncbi:nuclease-related domain-containing protein [Alkalibacterium psychrotolerans]
MESKQLKILAELQRRQGLNKEDSDYLEQLLKGFEGEKIFDEKLESLNTEYLILQDLQLEVNRQTFQIDTLVLSESKIVVYEVKNYQGEYVYSDKELIHFPRGNVILNPLTQLNRSVTLLKILLQKLNIKSEVSGKVVFVNPSFVLYNSPPSKEILLPQQIEKHIRRLNSHSISIGSASNKLADKLLEMHKVDERFIKVPAYSFEGLIKQVNCLECRSEMVRQSLRKSVCSKCDFGARNEWLIQNEVEVFVLLFPEKKVTTTHIHDWCGRFFSAQSIYKVLSRKYVQVGSKKGNFYVIDQ